MSMDVPEALPRVVRFGVFELDRRAGELRKEGMRVRLQEQPLRLLDALLAEPGEAVTRDALRQRLWPNDTFVDFDNGLNRAVSRLRAALADDVDNPRFIETLGRRGYRFIAPVVAPVPVAEDRRRPTQPETAGRAVSDTASPVMQETPAVPEPPRPDGRALMPETPPLAVPARGRVRWRRRALLAATLAAVALAVAPTLWRKARPAGVGPIRSLAVLPLANLTGDPTQEYFSDGMTDALITNLASLRSLRVISRQSVMRYKGSAKSLPEIARELGVEGVVEGSVVRSGGRVRITAQLIHAPSDRHLWAQGYERPLADVLLLQGELARAIAEAVRITISPEETRRLTPDRPVNPGAYDAYLLGRHHWNQRTAFSLNKALTYFQSAITQDPNFALAHAGLAQSYAPRAALGYVPPGEGLAEMKAAAKRALELDPGLGEAHAALAAAHVQEWDWEKGEDEFRSALQRDPNSSLTHLWYGWYLRARRRFEESLAHRRRALELDPLNIVVNRSVAQNFAFVGQDEAALAQWNRTFELEPDNAAAHLELGLFHIARRRHDAGVKHLERARALRPDDPLTLATLAFGYAVSANAPEAQRLLAQLEGQAARRYVSPVLPAFVHAALGRRDRAFALIEQAYAVKDPQLLHIQEDEHFSALRGDARYADLVRRMGLAPRRPKSPAG